MSQIDAFAATTGPGLAAALLVGASAAKGLALGAGKPFLAVNHLEGHLLSPFFGESEIPAHVALIVSGGHTLLFDVEGYGRTTSSAERWTMRRVKHSTRRPSFLVLVIPAAPRWTGSRDKGCLQGSVFLAA